MSLVRRSVVFKPEENIQIPYKYNHDVMRNIYYYISVINENMEKFLHNEGYRVENSFVYKLFNFTLRFTNANFEKEYIELNEDSTVTLILSGKDDILNTILRGLLHIRCIKIGNIEIPLKTIEKEKPPIFRKVMLYRALSPVVTTIKNENGYVVSLDPYVSKYYENLAMNLKRKYKLIYEEDFNGPLYFDINDVLTMREKSHDIKGIYKKGYLFDIWVETTPKMQRIIYYLGLGENNSTGAGCLSLLKVGDIIE